MALDPWSQSCGGEQRLERDPRLQPVAFPPAGRGIGKEGTKLIMWLQMLTRGQLLSKPVGICPCGMRLQHSHFQDHLACKNPSFPEKPTVCLSHQWGGIGEACSWIRVIVALLSIRLREAEFCVTKYNKFSACVAVLLPEPDK